MSALVAAIGVTREDGFGVEVELSIEAGQTMALLGPNGAGKTTVVHALAGLIGLDRGRIILGEEVLDEPASGVFVSPEHRSIGVVFQDYLLFPRMSVLDNIAFGLRSRGVRKDDARRRARESAAPFAIGGSLSRRPGDLSGGEAQRVALARALVAGPELLLLDEPLSALDVTTRARVRTALGKHLDAFEGPRLLITHDPTEAFLLADEICIIENGTITQRGPADEISLRPRTRYAADLAGSNLVQGDAVDGVVSVEGHTIHIADRDVAGPVLLTVHPHSISVYENRPEGSPRNTWHTKVSRIESTGHRVRFVTGAPLVLTVEVTREAATELALSPDSPVWVTLKATEIGVETA